MTVPLVTTYSGTIPDPFGGQQGAAEFTTNSFTFTTWQANDLAVTFNASINQFNIETVTVNNNASSAQQSAIDAALSASAADSSANFKGLWGGLTGALNKPASVEYNGLQWRLLNNLADVTTSEPGVTGDWSEISPKTAARLTGGGNLSVSLVNQIQDSLAYYLPLAADYTNGKYIDVQKEDLFKAQTPTVNRKTASADLLEYSGGTDTAMQLKQNNREYWRYTSDGVNKWSVS